MELPLLAPVYEKYRDQGFEFLAISMKRTTEQMVADIVKEKGLPFHFLLDETGPENVRTPSLFGLSLLGYVCLIDKQGEVRYYFDKWTDEDTVSRYDKLVGQLLRE